MLYRARTLLLAVVSCFACAHGESPPASDVEEDAGPTTGPVGSGGTPAVKADAAPAAVTPHDAAPTVSADTAAPPDPEPADAAPAAPTDAATTTPMPAPAGDYACTMMIGINATNEWYSQGFEKLVDNDRWEIVRVHSGFVTLWADPKAGVWGTKASSPCAKNADNPDRVIFVGLQFDFTTLDQWLPPLTAVVKNLKEKYPGVKNIELATFVRAPGNKACPQAPAKRSTIAAAEDEAIAMVAAANPGLVTISPKFEALTCGEFSGNPPHPSGSGGAAWAKRIADHYNKE